MQLSALGDSSEREEGQAAPPLHILLDAVQPHRRDESLDTAGKVEHLVGGCPVLLALARSAQHDEGMQHGRGVACERRVRWMAMHRREGRAEAAGRSHRRNASSAID